MLVSTIRTALADAIRAGTTATNPRLTVYPYKPDAVVVPAMFVVPDKISFDETFGRGEDELTFKLVLLVSRADDLSSQKLLDGYLDGSGGRSIKTIVEAGPTLGGACDDIRVVDVTAYRWFPFGENEYLGAEFSLSIIGRGA